MTHNSHTDSVAHKELDALGRTKLLELVKDWQDPIELPPLEIVKLTDGRRIHVARDDLTGFGTKARAGHAVFHQPEYRATKVVVYVAPRVGWAPLSLAKLCKDTGRRLVLFCPASAEPSIHQKTAAALGAELRFCRIAAMPNLQKLAKSWAVKHGYTFFPLGLDVPAAVAGIAKTAEAWSKKNRLKVKEFWTVMSTGVLSRGLQVAWPDATPIAVAVARNMKAGEVGRAAVISHSLDFTQAVKSIDTPPFPSVLTYDAKAWRHILENASDGAVFWNVAAEPPVQPLEKKYKSDVPWSDMSAFDKP